MRYPALLDLDKDPDPKSWFRPMMESIGINLLGEVGWGLRSRLAIGALLGTLDILSDIVVSYVFLEEEEYSYAYFTLGTVALNFFIGTILAVVQHWRMGVKIILREMLFVIFALKPVIDCYRLIYYQKNESWNETRVLSPLQELTSTKLIEIFSEAVPGGIIQIYAYIKRGRKTNRTALVSILSLLFRRASRLQV